MPLHPFSEFIPISDVIHFFALSAFFSVTRHAKRHFYPFFLISSRLHTRGASSDPAPPPALVCRCGSTPPPSGAPPIHSALRRGLVASAAARVSSGSPPPWCFFRPDVSSGLGPPLRLLPASLWRTSASPGSPAQHGGQRRCSGLLRLTSSMVLLPTRRRLRPWFAAAAPPRLPLAHLRFIRLSDAAWWVTPPLGSPPAPAPPWCFFRPGSPARPGGQRRH